MTREEIDKVRGVLQMSGWRDVMSPMIENRLKNIRDLALMLPGERPTPYSTGDDAMISAALRGEAKGLAWVLHAFENHVAVDRVNQEREDIARQSAPPL